MAAGTRTFEVVKAAVLSAHAPDLKGKNSVYTSWAGTYDQDTDVLEYRAPTLAAESISKHFSGDRGTAVTLDVACGTGKVAKQLKARGFERFVGVDGCEAMLTLARGYEGLYQELQQLFLVEEPLPARWENFFDVVAIVGALCEGHVSVPVVKDLYKASKPGGYICMTTRGNPDNLEYKAALELELKRMEDEGLWRCVEVNVVEEWERAVVDTEGFYIPGVVYLYQKI